MTKKLQRIVIALTAIFAVSAYAVKHQGHDHSVIELCEGFIPENDMSIPVYTGLRSAGQKHDGITEAEFNEAIDRLEKYFTREVEEMGLKLRVNRLWTNATVNASAQRSGNTQVVNMYGGLARHPQINFEGFALVLCHEYGHHNGGAPKNVGWFSNWATNEGGSDYYATLKCLRTIFSEDDNKTILAQRSTELDVVAVEACSKAFAEDETGLLLCLRSSLAGQSVANFFAASKKDEKKPEFSTPDSKEVSRTNDTHPATQCRLDTYFAGMICPVAVTDKVSAEDYKRGSCFAPQDAKGMRPRCWFAPN